MKILFLSRLFYPHIGGVEKHVIEISKILTKKGHEVTVLTEKHNEALSEIDLKDKIKIVRINPGKNNWFKKFRIWKNIWNNRKFIFEADAIHIHDVFFWILPFRLFVNKPIYMTFHGYEGDNIPGLKARFMHKMAEKLSKGNICVGDFLKKWYGTKPDYVIFGGVNLPNVKSKVLCINRNKLKFLLLGRLEEETGIMVYLQALKLLKQKKYKLELTVLGDGSLMKSAKAFAAKNKINVVFKGFLNKVDNYIQDSDFVLTSRYLGIMEALSLSKLVFAVYNNEIKKDYLEMSPLSKFISISEDSQQLSNEIIKFVNNKDVDEMIRRGRVWSKKNTWDNIVLTYLSLWRINKIIK